MQKIGRPRWQGLGLIGGRAASLIVTAVCCQKENRAFLLPPFLCPFLFSPLCSMRAVGRAEGFFLPFSLAQPLQNKQPPESSTVPLQKSTPEGEIS